jgi:hypothetical protein
MSCALFLAKFMTHLAASYEKLMMEAEKRVEEFDSKIYHDCLVEMLDLYSEEDADEHGRLVEIKKMCLNFDENHPVQMEEEEKKKWTSNDVRVFEHITKEMEGEKTPEMFEKMRSKYLYYSSWEKLFVEEDTTLIHRELLPSIRKELLTKKGIFQDPHQYDVLESHIEILIRQLQEYEELDKTYDRKLSKRKLREMERKQMEEIKRKKRAEKEKELLARRKGGKKRRAEEESKMEEEEKEESKVEEEEKEEGEGEEEENVEIKKVKTFEDYFPDVKEEMDEISFEVKGNLYYFDYEIACHCRLAEYFSVVKKGLRSFLLCGKLSNTDIFCPNKITVLDQMKKLDYDLQIYHHIIFGGQIELDKLNNMDVKMVVKDLMTYGALFDDLGHHIAKALTIARRKDLMNLEKLSDHQIDKIGTSLYAGLSNAGYTDLQILGLIDCKYAEASAYKLMTLERLTFTDNQKMVIFPFNFFPYKFFPLKFLLTIFRSAR